MSDFGQLILDGADLRLQLAGFELRFFAREPDLVAQPIALRLQLPGLCGIGCSPRSEVSASLTVNSTAPCSTCCP